MEQIIREIESENWDNALGLFLKYAENESLDETAYILGATIMEHYGEHNSMYEFIAKGLRLNPCNYELYLLLGNYYSLNNANQAYIAYENALYHCINSEDNDGLDYIKQLIINHKACNCISVRNVSFVILSYNNIDYTKICIESIRDTCYSECYEIIVIDNDSKDGSLEWLREQDDIILIENEENKGFPVSCNQGINSANPNNDIFLLNNDTIMLPNSLFWLRIGLYNDSTVGAAGAVTNYAVNGQTVGKKYSTVEEYIRFGYKNNVPCTNPYEYKAFLMMFAMLIKRESLNTVGSLDERFTPGNFEDNDYGLRLMENGYKCILCHNSYIIHFGSKSFRKDAKHYHDVYWKNREKLKDKWGFYDDYYTHARNDVISLINAPSDSRISILEIGCGLGETLAKIKYNYPLASVNGVEIVNKIALLGSKRFNIKCGDIESMTLEGKYDYILFPDVLEHLREPENTLFSMQSHLNDNGHIIASIPNLMNATVIRDLLSGNFTYQEAGILDHTHLRFFTLNEIRRMFDNAGYEINQLSTVVFPEESTDTYKDFFDILLSIEGVAPRELFDVYQFIVKASPKKQDK